MGKGVILFACSRWPLIQIIDCYKLQSYEQRKQSILWTRALSPCPLITYRSSSSNLHLLDYTPFVYNDKVADQKDRWISRVVAYLREKGQANSTHFNFQQKVNRGQETVTLYIRWQQGPETSESQKMPKNRKKQSRKKSYCILF